MRKWAEVTCFPSSPWGILATGVTQLLEGIKWWKQRKKKAHFGSQFDHKAHHAKKGMAAGPWGGRTHCICIHTDGFWCPHDFLHISIVFNLRHSFREPYCPRLPSISPPPWTVSGNDPTATPTEVSLGVILSPDKLATRINHDSNFRQVVICWFLFISSWAIWVI